MLLIVAGGTELAIRRQRAQARHVPIELGGEESGATHLAVGDHVDARRFLVADREIDRVVEHLGEIRGTELAALRRGNPRDEPAGVGMRPDDARDELVRHRSTSENAKARAGFWTKRRSLVAAPRPWWSMSALNSRSRYERPGEPPNAR